MLDHLENAADAYVMAISDIVDAHDYAHIMEAAGAGFLAGRSAVEVASDLDDFLGCAQAPGAESVKDIVAIARMLYDSVVEHGRD